MPLLNATSKSNPNEPIFSSHLFSLNENNNYLIGRMIIKREQEQTAYSTSKPAEKLAIVENESLEYLISWCYAVVDELRISREIVSICSYYFHKFLEDNHQAPNIQLVAITCLYLAIKIQNSKQTLSIEMMKKNSGSRFQTIDILKMEIEILTKLDWRINPPTSYSFVHDLFDLIFWHRGDFHDKLLLFKVTIYLVELTLFDTFFASFEASAVACSAMTVALKSYFVQNATNHVIDDDDFKLLLYEFQGVQSFLQIDLNQLSLLYPVMRSMHDKALLTFSFKLDPLAKS